MKRLVYESVTDGLPDLFMPDDDAILTRTDQRGGALASTPDDADDRIFWLALLLHAGELRDVDVRGHERGLRDDWFVKERK